MAHKVDSSGATAQNEFTNGGGAVARTRLEAKFCNMVQREVVAIPTARGLALSDTDDQQLLQCLIMHVADITGLRAMPVPTIPSTQSVGVFVRDAGSGLARFYAWASTSSAADNAGTVIRPSSNPATGRWLSISMMDAGTTSSVAWASVTGKPTTVSGYGITDMGGQSVNYANSAGAVPWSGVSSKPTTIAGYGITDHSWSNLSGKPTTVAGYGITDMGSQSVNFANIAGAVPWSGVSSRPTTLSGYGITDAPTVIGGGASGTWSISISGYGYPRRWDGTPVQFIYNGQSGQPTWLWGTNNGVDYYVWNPANFSVSYANSAGAVPWTGVSGRPSWSSSLGGTGYRVCPDGFIEQWTTVSFGDVSDDYIGTLSWPIAFPNAIFGATMELIVIDPEGVIYPNPLPSKYYLDSVTGLIDYSTSGCTWTVQELSGAVNNLAFFIRAIGR